MLSCLLSMPRDTGAPRDPRRPHVPVGPRGGHVVQALARRRRTTSPSSTTCRAARTRPRGLTRRRLPPRRTRTSFRAASTSMPVLHQYAYALLAFAFSSSALYSASPHERHIEVIQKLPVTCYRYM